jgi:serine/threonine-protein kinase RsbW
MKSKKQRYKLKIPDQAGFNNENQEKIALAVDEACTNVIKHAHKFDSQRLIDISIQNDAQKMKIKITDKGGGFEINKIKDPDIKKYVKEARHGGLGIYLIKTLMDDVQYEFTPGVKNQVQLTKYKEGFKAV